MQRSSHLHHSTSNRRKHLILANGERCEVCDVKFPPVSPDGDQTVKLIAHHIKPVAYCRSRREAQSLRNLMIVCKYCHKDIHQRMDNERFLGTSLTVREISKAVAFVRRYGVLWDQSIYHRELDEKLLLAAESLVRLVDELDGPVRHDEAAGDGRTGDVVL